MIKRFLSLVLLAVFLLLLAGGCQTDGEQTSYNPDDQRLDHKPWNAPAEWQYNAISPNN